MHKCLVPSVRSFLEYHTRFETKMGKVYTLPDGAAHTYMAYIREYPPPRAFRLAFIKQLVVAVRFHFFCFMFVGLCLHLFS